jgi:UDP-N-acetylglucosamine--N-acetylmuramyl-(pentapeptide) pyrophosphoryl-undecaprenol N-acetylglucosamine transferase
LIHEQNAIAGTTNRILARFASRVYEAFPGSFPQAVAVVTIGNPVRDTIARLVPRSRPQSGRPHLLILGGSQGALALNCIVPQALRILSDRIQLDVRHQAGRSIAAAESAYREAGVEADLTEFIDDMADAYGWADIVIARAGALTIAELTAAGVGAILVPYPFAIDNHQQRNAEHFAANGAGIVVREAELTADSLALNLGRCLAQAGELERMARAARAQAKPEAASELALACLGQAGVSA